MHWANKPRLLIRRMDMRAFRHKFACSKHRIESRCDSIRCFEHRIESRRDSIRRMDIIAFRLIKTSYIDTSYRIMSYRITKFPKSERGEDYLYLDSKARPFTTLQEKIILLKCKCFSSCYKLIYDW